MMKGMMSGGKGMEAWGCGNGADAWGGGWDGSWSSLMMNMMNAWGGSWGGKGGGMGSGSAPKGPAPPSDNIYIKGFSEDITEAALRAIMTKYGTVTSCRVLQTVPGRTSGTPALV